MIKKGYQCNYIAVIGDKAKYENNSASYLCQCKCGEVRYVKDNVLRYNHIQDCGCGLYQLDRAKENFISKKYNLLTIIDCFRKEYQGRNRIFAKCKCDCGKIYEANLTEIRNGHIKSCGCLRKSNFDRDYKNKIYHGIQVVDLVVDSTKTDKKIVKCKCKCGKSFTAHLIDLLKNTRYIIGCKDCNDGKYFLYNIKQSEELKDGDIKRILYGIKSRCNYPNRKDRKWYYDKHIKICNEWLNNSDAFVKWAKNNGYKKGLTIDRIDNNGNYEPNNCRWVDMETQNNNQSNSKKYLFHDELLSLAQISRKINMNYRTLLGRITRRMNLEDAISTPIKNRSKICQNLDTSMSTQKK